jgi:soluble lytic murein transglycosylase-like protein
MVSAIFAAGFVASPASAQVMEISADGTVSVRDGSGEATFTVLDGPSEAASEPALEVQVPVGALTNIDQAGVPSRFAAAMQNAAAAAGISPVLLSALVWQESRWNPGAVSPKGAIGLTQLMPQTARELGVDPTDPVANLAGGARYLRQLLNSFDGNVEKALAAYNAGPARVIRANGIPAIPETRAYVASVVQRISSTQSRGDR